MAKQLFKYIHDLVNGVLCYRDNMKIANMIPDAIENLLISLCLSYLDPFVKKDLVDCANRELSPASLAELFRENVKKDYPVHFDLSIPSWLLEKLALEMEKVGELLPAVIHEFFLENKTGKSIDRKKSGTYYTPGWVVQDIVDHSIHPGIARILDSFQKARNSCDFEAFLNTWNHLQEFRVIDPACGWGIFLLETYRILDKFYRQVGKLAKSLVNKCARSDFDVGDLFSKDYINLLRDNRAIQKVAKECAHPGKRILSNHLFGFDIHASSTKLALNLLRILADRNDQKLNKHFPCHVETTDFIRWMEKPQMSFDVILGNPPYFTIGGGGRGRAMTEFHKKLKNHPVFANYFRSQSDIFYYFIIGGIKILKPGGVISFIVPSYWLDNQHADRVREELIIECRMEEIVNFTPYPVFETATGKPVGIDTMIFRAIKKDSAQNLTGFNVFVTGEPDEKKKKEKARRFLKSLRSDCNSATKIEAENSTLGSGKWTFSGKKSILDLLIKDGKEILPLGDITGIEMQKYPGEFACKESTQMEGICEMGQGQETGLSEVFVVGREKAEQLGLEKDLLKPNIKNRNVRKWWIEDSDEFMIMTDNSHDIDDFPYIKKYLEFHRTILEKRQRVKTRKRKWYAISIPQNYDLFARVPKILVPYRATENRFAIDFTGYYNDGGDVRAIAIKPYWQDRITNEYLLALLNSQLINFWYSSAGKRKGNIYEYFTRPLSRIPVRIPSMDTQNEIGNIVRNIINLAIKDNHPEIKKMEERIDKIISRIYGI